MPSAEANHSHRATTKGTSKPFKSKKASKGALRDQAKGRFRLSYTYSLLFAVLQLYQGILLTSDAFPTSRQGSKRAPQDPSPASDVKT